MVVYQKFTTKNFQGFTLIELLVVIVIVGILAVALIPRLTGAQASAKHAALKAGLRTMMSQAQMYYNDYGTYSGFCNNDIQLISLLNDLKSSGIKVACYTHPFNGQHNNSRGVAGGYQGKYFAGNSLGVVSFDKPKTTGSNWHTAVSTCVSEGKRLADIEQLKALYDAQGTAPRGEAYRPYWSATEVPTNTANAYYAHLDNSIYSGDVASGQPKTYTPIYVVCVQ